MKDPSLTFASAVASRTVAVCSVPSHSPTSREGGSYCVGGELPLARIVHGRQARKKGEMTAELAVPVRVRCLPSQRSLQNAYGEYSSVSRGPDLLAQIR
jgi:hypothetical protein